MFIKVYHSFCGEEKLIINGHVFQHEPIHFDVKDSWLGSNIKSLLTLFRVKPLTEVKLKIHFFNQIIDSKSDENGYFMFECKPANLIPHGWHSCQVKAIDNDGNEITHSEGKFFKPYKTSHGIISDIDDTVLKSYSASIFRRLYEMISKNPEERKLFDHTVEWYRKLAETEVPGEESNPFFYVSSSEWNLYDYLNTIFKKHQLPEGIFLLNDLKKLKNFFQTGKTGHQGKYDRIKSLLEAFPNQNYILIGDNTQQDPYIYKKISLDFPGRIIAVFLRNKSKNNAVKTQKLLSEMCVEEQRVLLFDTTLQALKKSKEWGLIDYKIDEYIF
ncbi:Uncharacterized conserved protein (DUF2183) [Candidatus Ornithobacterium hominis]|uniref:Uncharacterized conserved protein (DUF2183) n=1 Tax=Candidatus Ornithobacterium hominis TaxID=2497989 RepID=A0A383U0T3_9FLAO|nr:App1 family protein [Candidatus Ornithobacterium hominis]MCT7904223.1 App1 family protein [Candidatus Ornithobacterium hominis]SZD72886.1 Uncharacterized conserved protein (DUF2183) [Candidatus Ornithobacterium hominis]SZD73018.1 Uncharacterized conserved protein (DUF2183) [Candidatus Ornithobacterium hominis]